MANKSMLKLPTERTLFYNTGGLSSITWTGGIKFNIVRDLAAINRHNVAHTTSKGVPLVYRCAVTLMPQVDTGTYNQIFDEDDAMIQVAEVYLAPQWMKTNHACSALALHLARSSCCSRLICVHTNLHSVSTENNRRIWVSFCFTTNIRGDCVV